MDKDAARIQEESKGIVVDEHSASLNHCLDDCFRRRLAEFEVLEQWNSGTEGGAYCSGDESKGFTRGYTVPKEHYIWFATQIEVLAGGGSAGVSYMRADNKYMEVTSHCHSGLIDSQHTKYKIHATIKRMATVDERQQIYARCRKECGH